MVVAQMGDSTTATPSGAKMVQRKGSSTSGTGPASVASPKGNSSSQTAHRKNPSSQQMVLSVQEETDDVVFSRDAQELLRRPSFSETLEKIQHTHRGWLRKLASNGRRWNRRYFVVHGHYLSYFKNDATNDVKNLMGALNLWRVESVTLDQNIIVVTLAPDISVNTNSLINRALTKKTMANRILLEAKDSAEASKWIATMNVTPFDTPSPTDKNKPVQEGETDDFDEGRSQASNAQTAPAEVLKIKSVRVNVSKDKVCNFLDVAELLDTTRLRIGELDAENPVAEVIVEISSSVGEKSSKSTVHFAPKDEANGVLRVPFPDGSEVQISWERDIEASIDELIKLAMAEDTPSSLLVPFAGGIFIVTWFIVRIVLEFRFLFSTIVAGIISGSAAAMLSAPQPAPRQSFYAANSPSGSRYVFTSIVLVSNKRLSEIGSSVTAKVTEAASSKKSVMGEDVSILPEEKPRLLELRSRLADIRLPAFIEKQAREGKLERLYSEWKVDTSQTSMAEVQDTVCDKYLDTDYRLVRFLRARSMNVDKAEKMARQSLFWRMGMRADFLVEHFQPPKWILEYGGAKLFVETLKGTDFGTEERLKKWWVRDKQGALSMFFRAGVFDWRKVNRKMGDATALVKVGIWALEVGRKDMDYVHALTNGAVPSYVTSVIDLECFSLTQQIPLTELIPLARKFFSVLATSFPELLKRVIIVNTPFLFNGLWQAIRPFIPEEVQDKIQIHGRCDVEKHLRPYFQDDQIPKYLGGKLVGDDGDPYCTNRLPPAGPFLPDVGAELLKIAK